jgi:hemoglobin/transferrin/lactoferrin receptor protein
MLIAAAGLVGAGQGWAQEAAPESATGYDLDEIVVTASRRKENAFAAPYTVNVQDATELAEIRQVRTVPEAMRELPGIMVQKTAHGQGSPYIRGFTGLRTLFLIDGIRLNNSTFREGPNQYWNTVDALTIERLEIVKGPSSALYGSDAIGGTVHAITRSYEDLSGAKLRGGITLRGASAENSMVMRPEAGFAHGDLAVYAGASFKDFGNLHAGSGTGTQPKTGYDEFDADLKLSYDIDADRRWIAALQYVDLDDAWRVHKTVFGKSWRGTTVGNELRRSLDQRRLLAYLQYRAEDVAALRGGRLTLSLSHQEQDERRLRVRSDGRADQQGVDVATLGLWGQVDIPARRGPWTAGVEIYRDDVDSFRNDFNADGSFRGSRIQGPVGDDARYVLVDAFAQKQFAVGRSGELTAGLRHTWSRADADAVQDPQSGEQIAIRDDWRKLTASARYTHELGERGRARVFAGVSQGFRAPNLSDLTRLDTARSNEIETPVPGLDPENFLTYELGLKFDHERWSGQVAVYHTSIDDMIIRTPTGRIIDGNSEVTKQNSGRGYVDGIELQARYQLTDALQVFGNVTWIDGEVDTFPDSTTTPAREPLDRLMPVRIYFGGRWEPPATKYWFEALLSAADKQDELSTRDRADTDRIPAGGTPGYGLVTLRGGWRSMAGWRVSVAAENLFDKNYRIHGSGVNEPGRNFIVSVFYTF